MKAMLLSLFLFLSFSTFSQVYDEDWYSSIEEPINFIIYKRNCESTIQFRIYRGDKDTYKVSIKNSKGVVVRTEELKKIDEIDISNIYPGVYTITAEDYEGNIISKELIIGS